MDHNVSSLNCDLHCPENKDTSLKSESLNITGADPSFYVEFSGHSPQIRHRTMVNLSFLCISRNVPMGH